jgi:uncharacterized protein (UPF0548 family)
VLAEQSNLEVTYASSGMVAHSQVPKRFKETGGSVVLGYGRSVFDAATQNIKQWRVHEQAGLHVIPRGAEVRESSDVILLMNLLIGYVTVSCRVVSMTHSNDQWGFDYGTLPHHVERGEELFSVALATDDSVTFTVRAMSRPGHFLTRVGAPVAQFVQRKATRNYLQAMVDLIKEEK